MLASRMAAGHINVSHEERLPRLKSFFLELSHKRGDLNPHFSLDEIDLEIFSSSDLPTMDKRSRLVRQAEIFSQAWD